MKKQVQQGWRYVCMGLSSWGIVFDSAYAMTIEEKRQHVQQQQADLATGKEAISIEQFNQQFASLSRYLHTLYEQVDIQNGIDEDHVADVLKEIRYVKQQLRALQEQWCAQDSGASGTKDGCVLWQQPDITIYHLIADYGSDRCIYLIPPEIGNIKVATFSRLSVPQESLEECLELILRRLGVVMRPISPWIVELSSVQGSSNRLTTLVSQKVDLERCPPSAFVGYCLDAQGDAHVVHRILQKFSDAHTIDIEIVGGAVFIFGTAGEIHELLKVYEFVRRDALQTEHRILSLQKMNVQEMMNVISAAFQDELKSSDESHAPKLCIVPLHYQKGIFVSGHRSVVQRVVHLVDDIEGALKDASERAVFWYSVKHADIKDLTILLSQVYDAFHMKSSGYESGKSAADAMPTSSASSMIHIDAQQTMDKQDPFYKVGSFIADCHTGTIIMVVEHEVLSHILNVLQKIDVPKQMVRIEVLLFERKVSSQNKSGLNLLRLGEPSDKHAASMLWKGKGGILEFLLQGPTPSSLLPGYDIAYQFMMAQEDVRINASPSVVTMNQTPATIAVVEEMSVSVSQENDKKQFNRAQYGIMIKVLPSINMMSVDQDGRHYITLNTDITFDTTGKCIDHHPEVTRRHITNSVRILDGETVIIGGLRRQHQSDEQDKIPFIGDVPGIGKLFGSSVTGNNETEMFVFITPKIMDLGSNQEQQQQEAMLSRPGETEEYEAVLQEAKLLAMLKQKEDSVSVCIPDHMEGMEYDGQDHS